MLTCAQLCCVCVYVCMSTERLSHAKPDTEESGVVVHICNPSTWEEATGS
jgi:hypothetical protein